MKFCKISLFFMACFFAGHIALAAVRVDDLTAIEASAYGAQKTIGFACWGKMPFDVLTRITHDLGQQKQSYELARMTADVLTQKTAVDCGDLTQQQGDQWNTVRLQTLLDLGASDKVIALAKSIPASSLTMDMSRIQADAYLVLGQLKNACVIAAKYRDKSDYFTQMDIACLALNGQQDRAVLAFELYNEKNKERNVFSYAMDTLFSYDTEQPKQQSLSVLDTYLLQHLNLPYDESNLPMAYQSFQQKQAGRFGRAVDIGVLLQRWEGIDLQEQQYRLYLLMTYRDLFAEKLKFIHTRQLWQQPVTRQSYDVKSFLLLDKPETQITGSDLLLSLWVLSERSMPVDNALILLDKMGLDIETFVVERLN